MRNGRTDKNHLKAFEKNEASGQFRLHSFLKKDPPLPIIGTPDLPE